MNLTALSSVQWWRKLLSTTRLVLLGVLILITFTLFPIPLTQIVGYESAAIFGVVAGVASIFATIYDPRSNEKKPPFLIFLSQCVANALFVLIPFLLLLINGLRVGTCDLLTGIFFWALIPLPSSIIGTTLGVVIAQLFEKRWLQLLLAIIIPILSLNDLILQLLLEPPIIGYNLFLGYYAGSLYDEALSIPVGLIIYRILNTLLIASFIATLSVYHKIKEKSPFKLALAGNVLLIVVTLLCYSQRKEFGIDMDHPKIAEALGGRTETAHFVIIYPTTAAFPEEVVERIRREHEYQYARLKRFFDLDPVESSGTKMTSFIYASPDQKEALMGGRNTMIAKIWLNEFHIVWNGIENPILSHEMAHLFTRPFAAAPLDLSSNYGIWINMGLVEGIATAAEWSAQNFTPHEAAAALLQLGQLPDMNSLIGASGFWTSYSGVAYRVSGSFIRYLIDTYGIEKFKKAYPHGELERVYGKPMPDLISEWTLFLQKLPLTQDDLARARTLFQQRSIFSKVCPRRIGTLLLESEQSENRQEWRLAIENSGKIVSLDPQNVNYLIRYASLLTQIPEGIVIDTKEMELPESLKGVGANLEGARKILLHLLTRYEEEKKRNGGEYTPNFSPLNISTIYSMLGDIAWKELDEKIKRYGKNEEMSREEEEIRNNAIDWYRKALKNGADTQTARFLEIKIALLKELNDEILPYAYNYLINRSNNTFPDYDLFQLWINGGKDSIINYLLGRRLILAQRWHDALELLEPVVFGGERDREALPAIVREEAKLLIIQGLYHESKGKMSGEWREKALRLAGELEKSRWSHYRVAGKEWMGRIHPRSE